MFLNFKNLISAFVLSVVCLGQAYALPIPPTEMTAQKLMSLRPSGNLRAANFRAIIALSNCSGSLVRYENSVGTDKAMVLTNGHCLGGGGFLKPGEVVVDKAVSRGLGLLNNDGSKVATLTADRVIFATMTKSDMTLYRLTKTYDELFKTYGVQALVISSKHPVERTPIAVVSGYWKKIYTCNMDKFIFALREDAWTFKDSVRYTSTGCNTIGGTSGSPIINTDTYEVVGVNNTGNESGQRCTMNNPCEVDEKGNVTVVPHASYGQQTFWLYSCLNQNRQFDINLPGCALRPQ